MPLQQANFLAVFLDKGLAQLDGWVGRLVSHYGKAEGGQLEVGVVDEFLVTIRAGGVARTYAE